MLSRGDGTGLNFLMLSLWQYRPVTRGAKPLLEKFSPPGKMCWTYFKTIGHSLKYLSPFEKTFRPPWCPKLVKGLWKYLQKATIIESQLKMF